MKRQLIDKVVSKLIFDICIRCIEYNLTGVITKVPSVYVFLNTKAIIYSNTCAHLQQYKHSMVIFIYIVALGRIQSHVVAHTDTQIVQLKVVPYFLTMLYRYLLTIKETFQKYFLFSLHGFILMASNICIICNLSSQNPMYDQHTGLHLYQKKISLHNQFKWYIYLVKVHILAYIHLLQRTLNTLVYLERKYFFSMSVWFHF